MRTEMSRTLLLLVVGLLAKVLGLPNGAPPETCYDLTPRHPGSSPQLSHTPYQILPVAGQRRVRLTLGSPQGLPYEGFMIMARDANTGGNVGEFTNLPDAARYVECTRGEKNGVTHINTDKKHNLEFDWQAPNDYEGTIIFNSTFAQDYSTYWIGVESARVVISKRSIDVLATPTPAITFRTTTPPFYRPTVDYTTSTCSRWKSRVNHAIFKANQARFYIDHTRSFDDQCSSGCNNGAKMPKRISNNRDPPRNVEFRFCERSRYMENLFVILGIM